MKTQQRILKYTIIIGLAVIFIVTCFLFIRWLYWDNSSDEALAVFNDYSIDDGKLEQYRDNLFINIINNVLPAAKAGYEGKYGQKLPGIAGTVYSNIFNGMNFNIRDPKTYFSFVFTAFSQYEPQSGLLSVVDTSESILPSITSYDQAPEGEIFFDDEVSEYLAEEAANAEQPLEGETEEGYADVADPERIEIEKKQPSILVLHTHSMESYSPFTANNYHSLAEKETVVQIGSIMTDVLESKYKYNVIHDKTKHDKESYAKSYINSQQTIIKQLEQNKSLRVVLDVHRDAFDIKNTRDAELRKNDYTTTVNGKKAARIMLVIGEGNPNFAELQKFAVYVQKKMDKLYPGLFYKVVTKPKNKYNQFYRDHTLLIEVGCTLNTVEEAKYSAELMGNVVGEVLKDLEQ